jgi:hypothetical protein
VNDLDRTMRDGLAGLRDLDLDEQCIDAAVERARRPSRGGRAVRAAGAVGGGAVLAGVVTVLLVLGVRGGDAGDPSAGADGVWTVEDLLPWGDLYPFVDKVTETYGDEDYETSPRYGDLPPHPGILFPVGVSYRDAIRSMWRARNEGLTLPSGAQIVPPLPTGVVVVVRDDGRVAIDSAAPEGWEPRFGRLSTGAIGNAPPREAPPLLRCQVQLGDADVPPSCDGARLGTSPTVREATGGGWTSVAQPSAPDPIPQEQIDAVRISVLEGPGLAEGAIPQVIRDTARANDAPPEFASCRLDLTTVRLLLDTGSRRLYAATDGADRVWLFDARGSTVGSTCGPRDIFVSRGAMTMSTGGADPLGRTLAGILPDGFTTVTAGDVSVPVEGNGFVISGAPRGTRVVATGPAGERDIGRL